MATTQTRQIAQTPQQTTRQFTRVMRIVYMVIAWAFIAGLFLQFFFAGLSIFVGPTWWDTHTAFGRGFGVTTVLLVLFALLGRLPRRQIVMTAIFIPLYVLQILLIELPSVSPGQCCRHAVVGNSSGISSLEDHTRRYKQLLRVVDIPLLLPFAPTCCNNLS